LLYGLPGILSKNNNLRIDVLNFRIQGEQYWMEVMLWESVHFELFVHLGMSMNLSKCTYFQFMYDLAIGTFSYFDTS
jgi:hypothetical protein